MYNVKLTYLQTILFRGCCQYLKSIKCQAQWYNKVTADKKTIVYWPTRAPELLYFQPLIRCLLCMKVPHHRFKHEVFQLNAFKKATSR